MFDFELMKKLKLEGNTANKTAEIMKVGRTTLYRNGWSNLPFNNQSICKYKKDFNYFKNIDTSNKAYILGFILADGSISENGNLRIEINEKDLEVLKFIQSEIAPDIPLKRIERVRTKDKYKWTSITYLFQCKCKNFCSDLNKWNIVPGKTYKKQCIPNIKKEYVADFIRGYFDGDGSVWFQKDRVRINFTGEYNLLKEISSLLFKEASFNKLYKVKQKVHQKDSVLTICSNYNIKCFKNYIYNNNFSLTRKKERFNNV